MAICNRMFRKQTRMRKTSSFCVVLACLSFWLSLVIESFQSSLRSTTTMVVDQMQYPTLDLYSEMQRLRQRRVDSSCYSYGLRTIPIPIAEEDIFPNDQFRTLSTPLIYPGAQLFVKNVAFHITMERQECIQVYCSQDVERIHPPTEFTTVPMKGDAILIPVHSHYFHFFYDTVLRIFSLHLHGGFQQNPNATLLVWPRSLEEMPAQLEFLKLFQFDDWPTRNTTTIKRGAVYQFTADTNLIVPQNNQYHTKDELYVPYNVWLQGLLRRRLKVPEEPQLELFVSRGGYRRAIIREDELYDALQSFLPNLKRIFPDNFTVTEQAAMFAESKLVIAQHGAALTNMLFSNWDKVVLIEISSHLKDNAQSYPTFRNDLQVKQHHLLRCQSVHGEPIDLNETYAAEIIRGILADEFCGREDFDIPRISRGNDCTGTQLG